MGMIVQTFLNGKIFQVFEIQRESEPGLNSKKKEEFPTALIPNPSPTM